MKFSARTGVVELARCRGRSGRGLDRARKDCLLETASCRAVAAVVVVVVVAAAAAAAVAVAVAVAVEGKIIDSNRRRENTCELRDKFFVVVVVVVV